jgi:hypothetical protein
MKKIAILFLAFFSLLFSCNKDKINNTADKVGISKVTYYPIITVAGDGIMAVANGSAFTDPGATAKAGSADVPVTTSGTVNTAEDGVYTITYSAVNVDGFGVTAYRTVAVYTTEADAALNDLSGTYIRPATGVNVYWDKIAPGVYIVTNPGGAGAGANLTVIVFNASGFDIHAPSQRSSDGNISSTSGETFTPGTPDTKTCHFLKPGYGTQLRSFIKQ